MRFWHILLDSISDNMIIIIAFSVDFIMFVIALTTARWISKHFEKSNVKGLKGYKGYIYYIIDITYTVFTAIVSMYPLLGMLGTVIALIELGEVFQTANSDMTVIKSEFFLALTSTAWGIIFSLIFKFVNALFQPFIENQIERAKTDLLRNKS